MQLNGIKWRVKIEISHLFNGTVSVCFKVDTDMYETNYTFVI